MPALPPSRHACIVCGVGTLPNPDSVGFSFVAYKDAGIGKADGICPTHAAEDLRAHKGNAAAYRAALLNAGFHIHPGNWNRLLHPTPPPGATCTKRVVPRESWGAFHASPCGRKAKSLTKAGEPRCGIHDEAKAEAFADKARAEAAAKAADLDRRTARAKVLQDALACLKASQGRVSGDQAWVDERNAILARAATLEA